jgi:hypothetical protein
MRRILCSRSSRGWRSFSIAAGIIFTAATSKGDSAELGVAVFTEGFGQRDGLGTEAQRLDQLVLGHLALVAEFLDGRRTAELELKARLRLLHARQRVAGVHREADGAPRIGDASGDGLADPPGGVGRELESLAPVELLDGVHQPEVPFLDEVEQGQARRLVLLGDRDDQAQVRLDEVTLGLVTAVHRTLQRELLARGDLDLLVGLGDVHLGLGLAALLDGLGETDLIVLGQEGVLANIGEVEAYEVLIIPIDAIFCHGAPLELSDRRIRHY